MANVEVAQQQEEIAVQQNGENKQRHCDFYITPRGCIKGDACDFLHPVAPNGAVTTRVCDFFKSPRGCAKDKECDFLHIEARGGGMKQQQMGMMGMGMGGMGMGGMGMGMGGMGMGGMGMGMAPPAGQKVCQFYGQPRGCIKGDQCDFWHPPAGQGAHGMDASAMGGAGRGQGKPCDYFFSARGCVKGNECDFSHVSPAMGGFGAAPMYGQQVQFMQGRPMQMGGPGVVEKKPQKCDFFNTERGCIKGDLCDFIHTKDKVCDFFLTERGCRKGKFCDFLHPEDGAAAEGGENGADRTKARAKRYAPY